MSNGRKREHPFERLSVQTFSTEDPFVSEFCTKQSINSISARLLAGRSWTHLSKRQEALKVIGKEILRLRRLLGLAALLLAFACTSRAQTTVNLPSTKCVVTANPAGSANYLTCSDIPMNVNGIVNVSLFAVLAPDGTVGSLNGFTSNVSFQFPDSTTTGPEPLTGTHMGMAPTSVGGSLTGSFTGQFSGTISFSLVWQKPVPCYRYCFPRLMQENGVLTLQ